jgi:hypothetical protein
MGAKKRVGTELSDRPARLYSLAGRYDNPFPTMFLAPIDCSKIPALNMSLHTWQRCWSGSDCRRGSSDRDTGRGLNHHLVTKNRDLKLQIRKGDTFDNNKAQLPSACRKRDKPLTVWLGVYLAKRVMAWRRLIK